MDIMKRREKKHMLGIIDKLCECLDESQKIFLDRDKLDLGDIKKRKEENELQIKTTSKILDSLLCKEIQEYEEREISELAIQMNLNQ